MFGSDLTETLIRAARSFVALGLRVVRDDGGSIRFRQALLRGLAFWAIDFAPWTAFCGGLVSAAVNPNSKRLGDLMAGTVVIRTRSPRPPQPIPDVPAALVDWTGQLELSRLPDDLVTASRHLVQRADGLLPYPRDQLAHDLAQARPTAPPRLATAAAEFLGAVWPSADRVNEPAQDRQWCRGRELRPAG